MAANGGEVHTASALTTKKSTTGYVWHERYMWHHGGKYAWNEWIQPTRHFESPESKRRLHNLLDASGLLEKLVRIPPRLATVEEITRFHTAEYVAKIQRLSAEYGGEAGDFATFGKGSYDIARLAVGGVLEAVDAVIEGRREGGEEGEVITNAYCLVRPPGHHAERDRGMGFCLFNNVALGALHAVAKHGLKRVAIVDYDVHHGNGTQQAFYKDPSVLFISIHQDSNYPAGTGYVEERGQEGGEGFTINIPLPPGSGSEAYYQAFDRVVLPAVRAFAPELLLVSSGYDAGFLDPLATMMLSSEHFRVLGQKMNGVAAEVCGGKIVYAHEGGYSDLYVPFCGHAVIEEMSGVKTEVKDCMLTDINHWGYHELQQHQDAVIKKCEVLVDDLQKRMAATK
ncbi:hypothetical protein VYU27_006185 [Nannochloropsis oceanica]